MYLKVKSRPLSVAKLSSKTKVKELNRTASRWDPIWEINKWSKTSLNNSKSTRDHMHTSIKKYITLHTRAFKRANLKITTCLSTRVNTCLRENTTRTNALTSNHIQMSNLQTRRTRSLLTYNHAFTNSNVLVSKKKFNQKSRLLNIHNLIEGFRLISHLRRPLKLKTC